MKILVTGNAGSGKTSVSEDLRQRVYLAYDADEGFGNWIHKNSGKRRSSRPTENRGDYYWIWDIEKIEKLLSEPTANTVFFCGLATNQAQIYKDFDKIIILNCDLQTIKRRLKSRQNNPFGKRPTDLDWALKSYSSIKSHLPSAKVIEVDANQTLNRVVDKIIKFTDEN